MSYRYVEVTRDRHVVTCTLSNPPHHTLTAGGVRELFDVLDDVEADASVRAPIALAAAKHAIQQGSRMPLEESLLLEQRCFDRTMRSKDAAGAMRAYLGGSATRYEWKGE